MQGAKFATAIDCIDGRTQLPVAEWLKRTYHIDYVDMITEPGPDRVLTKGRIEEVESIKSKVLISAKAHGSHLVAIAGHHDCAGNPVSKEEHFEQIKDAVKIIRSWNLDASVIGIWVNDKWEVEVVES